MTDAGSASIVSEKPRQNTRQRLIDHVYCRYMLVRVTNVSGPLMLVGFPHAGVAVLAVGAQLELEAPDDLHLARTTAYAPHPDGGLMVLDYGLYPIHAVQVERGWLTVEVLGGVE
jgi:hypothetical protein